MPGKHSLLSPSSASRWIACPGSARATEHIPDKSGVAADEGTLAHSIGELIIRGSMGWVTGKEYDRQLKMLKKHELYAPAMLEHCSDYATFVMEQYHDLNAASNGRAELILESRVDLSRWIPEPGSGGTTDATILAPGILIVNDLKYGKGVHVSAQENKQLMLYGLGALDEHELIYGIERIELNIFQPRLDNVSHYATTTAELLQWASDELVPAAIAAWGGVDAFEAGEHCRFCRMRTMCRTNAEYRLKNTELFPAPANSLSDAELVDIFRAAKGTIDWLDAVKTFMLEAANHGREWPGLKMVRSRANRKYTDPEAVIQKLVGDGYDRNALVNEKIIGIGDMEDYLGKKTFATLLDGLVEKPKGAPTLVDESDPRPAIDRNEDAIADFNDVDLEHQF